MFVRVAIPIPSEKTFTYAVPEALSTLTMIGKRVLVPFGKRQVTGFIIEVMNEAANDQTPKEILALPDPEPLFDKSDLDLFEWIARYYLHPLGKVLGEILPGGIAVQSDRWLRTSGADATTSQQLTAGQKSILDCMAPFTEGLPLSRLRKTMGKSDLYRDLRFLEDKGLVVAEERLNRPAVRTKYESWVALIEDNLRDADLTPKQSSLVEYLKGHGEVPVTGLRESFKNLPALLRVLKGKNIIRQSEKEVSHGPRLVSPIGNDGDGITLNEAQEKAVGIIRDCLASGHFSPCLLHGVTGSGKTEVYLHTIAEVLRKEGGAIYIVPEIALTAQLLSRISKRFPEYEVAIIHSGISRSSRYAQWKRIKDGEVRVVVGARSALFAPVQNLRLIIVDEEHDPSYKQDNRLRYNARDLSLVRGRFLQATVILGSATPAIQTYFHTTEGRYRYLTLPARIDDRPLPHVELVDLRIERDEQGLTPLLSRTLIDAIRETLAAGNQILLFLNRRGFHTYLFCSDCGRVFTCPNCDIALTHHASDKILKCHHCDFTLKAGAHCPGCKGSRIRNQGAGTERIEEEVQKLFPEARIARMDRDTTSRAGEAASILKRLERREIDVLVGTQMITKGHDFPAITLVGVIAADASLNIPDFRAAERTFQILTQVSGRGGRGDQPGRVVIQTYNPGHYAIHRAQGHDYAGFYADELALRRQLAYPPFSRIVGLHFSSLKKEEGRKTVNRIGVRARELSGGKIDIIGPAESPLTRIRGRHRWQLLLRGKESQALHSLAQKLLEWNGRDGIEIQVDVDPINFM
jgi:primosomal protein N' (replication factor Y)